jgi:alkylation response protein AidB-like acyl-CoA dehydrogenase
MSPTANGHNGAAVLDDADTAALIRQLCLPALAAGADPLAALDDHLDTGPCAVFGAGRPMHEAVLAVATARDYLESVARWLAGRRSFGRPMSDHPVLRRRLAWAVVAAACADAALAADQDEDYDCAAAVSAARTCVSACEQVHAAAGVFDTRPGIVHSLFARRLRYAPDAEPRLPAYRQLADMLAALPGGEAAQTRRLVAHLERICPAATATVPEELAVAQALAECLPPGTVGRVLVHRNIMATYLAGTPAARAAMRLLPAAADGSVLTALAVTEPHTGSDLAALTTRIRHDGPSRLLDGTKTYVTGGADCDALLVAAKTQAGVELVWVDPSKPGVTRRPLHARAWRGAEFARLDFHAYDVPGDAVHPGDGTGALLRGLGRERLMIAGQQLAYARRWLAQLPAPRPDLADRVRACGALLRRIAAGSGEPSLVDSSMAKLACCEAAADVADARLELLSAAGSDIQALIDDQAGARAATVAAGTTDLNLAIVEGKVTAMFGPAAGGRP